MVAVVAMHWHLQSSVDGSSHQYLPKGKFPASFHSRIQLSPVDNDTDNSLRFVDIEVLDNNKRIINKSDTNV